jgi:heme exporter protein C
MLRSTWWKLLSIILLVYTCIAGFLIPVPQPPGVPLQQTIRNLFFHVPMWFGMTILFFISVIYAIKYLKSNNSKDDIYSFAFAQTGIVLGLLGYATGMIWANAQWGKPVSGDPKQIGAAIGVLIYCAYFVLRGNVVDEKKARISAVYNIFAFAMLFPTMYILPRLVESLHPGGLGSEGNPGLNPKDSSASLKNSILARSYRLGFTLYLDYNTQN